MLWLAVRKLSVGKTRQGLDSCQSGLGVIAIRLSVVITASIATFDRVYVKYWHFLAWDAQTIGIEYAA
ncbi:hypothetical protein [Methylobacterium sp. Leaf456]|uniref:hypothetical protein n=1 Tax=Methylobacterium sp. Leaf456 TaxID=1736382 RepID=UPI0012E3C08D|nr:hypothetical protein [Methylobacterium sp. Leaf456]